MEKKTNMGFIDMTDSVLIVEDEFSIALDIEINLTKMGFNVIGIVDSFESCSEFLKSQLPSVVLMDINISGKVSGIEVAKWIKKYYELPVVFLTALSDEKTLEKILETESFGYLTKPYKEKDLFHTLRIAIKNHSILCEARKETHEFTTKNSQLSYSDNIFIKYKNKLVSIRLKDIFFLEAFENYTQLVSENKKWIINGFLKDIEPKLPNEFLRVHRSFIVNLDKIDRIEDNFIVILQNNIPIGRSYKSELSKKINII